MTQTQHTIKINSFVNQIGQINQAYNNMLSTAKEASDNETRKAAEESIKKLEQAMHELHKYESRYCNSFDKEYTHLGENIHNIQILIGETENSVQAEIQEMHQLIKNLRESFEVNHQLAAIIEEIRTSIEPLHAENEKLRKLKTGYSEEKKKLLDEYEKIVINFNRIIQSTGRTFQELVQKDKDIQDTMTTLQLDHLVGIERQQNDYLIKGKKIIESIKKNKMLTKFPDSISQQISSIDSNVTALLDLFNKTRRFEMNDSNRLIRNIKKIIDDLEKITSKSTITMIFKLPDSLNKQINMIKKDLQKDKLDEDNKLEGNFHLKGTITQTKELLEKISKTLKNADNEFANISRFFEKEIQGDTNEFLTFQKAKESADNMSQAFSQIEGILNT